MRKEIYRANMEVVKEFEKQAEIRLTLGDKMGYLQELRKARRAEEAIAKDIERKYYAE